VLTIHAEVEGRVCLKEFTELLGQMQSKGVTFIRLLDFAQELWRQPELIPRTSFLPGTLPGRAGTVSCQGGREDIA
jgi:hypothetical protein